MTKPVTQFTQDGKLPPSLHEYPYFCLWRYELNKKGTGYTKVPYQPRHPEWGAASTKKEDFADISTALAAATGFDGLGVGLFDNLCAIDIDHCIDDAGNLSKLAYNIIASMNSYTEYSPSGKGIRIFFYSSDPYDTERFYINRHDAKDGGEEWPQQQGLEIYCPSVTKKFVTITGNVQRKMNVEERGLELRAVLENYMECPTKQKAPTVAPRPSSLSDNEIITAATNEKGGKFKSLFYDGDISGYPSQSEADAALMSKLAFYTGGDEGRMVELFKQSALYGDIKRKGTARNQEKYLQRTAKSVSRQNEYYTPPTPKEERRPQPVEVKPAEIPQDEIFSHKVGNLIPAFREYIKDARNNHAIKTCYKRFNQAIGGGILPKFYVIGALTSLGKTTFVMQMADSMALNGTDVLVFSLEMAKEDIIARSLSRHTYTIATRNNDLSRAKTELDILMGERYREYTERDNDTISQAYDDYMDYAAEHISIYEGRYTAAKIREITKRYMDITGKIPAVVVDYLQIIQPPDDLKRGTVKEQTDANIDVFTAMRRELKTPVIAISAFNRNSYNNVADNSSFKESGNIEYAGDCVITLEPDVELSDKMNSNKQKIMDAMRQDTRQIRLTFQKNRGNQVGTVLKFAYNPKYNYFEETDGTL